MGRVVLRTVWEENIEWNLFSIQFLIRPFLETYISDEGLIREFGMRARRTRAQHVCEIIGEKDCHCCRYLEGTEMPAKPAALVVRTCSNSTFIVVRGPFIYF
jgi:hypothetical protein